MEIDKERLIKAEGMLIGPCKKRLKGFQLGKGEEGGDRQGEAETIPELRV